MKSPDLSFNGYIFLFLISKLKVSGGHNINRKVENITSHLYILIENHFTFSSESIFSGDKQSSKYIRYRPPPSLPPWSILFCIKELTSQYLVCLCAPLCNNISSSGGPGRSRHPPGQETL